MSTNGRLDVATLDDWDGHQNYLTHEASRQWKAFRNAYHEATGYWLYTSECYRPVGDPGDYARGRINTQWYWFEFYDGNTKWAAYPGSNSSHGEAVAADLVGWPEREILVSLAAEYGFRFPFDYEPWHIQYVGNPAVVASPDTTTSLEGDFMSALTDQQQIDLYNGVMALTASEIVPGNPFSWSQAVLNEIRDNLVGDEDSIKDALRRESRTWRLFRDTSKADDAPDAYVAVSFSLAPDDPRQVFRMGAAKAEHLRLNYLTHADKPEQAQKLGPVNIETVIRLAKGTDVAYSTVPASLE